MRQHDDARRARPIVVWTKGAAKLCADAERRVVAYTQLTPAAELPAPELVDRPLWLDANLALMRSVLDPVVTRMAKTSGTPNAVAMMVDQPATQIEFLKPWNTGDSSLKTFLKLSSVGLQPVMTLAGTA